MHGVRVLQYLEEIFMWKFDIAEDEAIIFYLANSYSTLEEKHFKKNNKP